MAAKNGVILTSAAMNGTMIQSGYQNGIQVFGAGGALEPFTYADAGVVFTVNTAGIVSLTFNDTYTYTADYDDGYDFMPITDVEERENNISITVPPGYSNTGGDPVTGKELFRQPAATLTGITMTSITDGTTFTNSYRVKLTGTIEANPSLPVSAAGFFVYEGNTLNTTIIRSNGEEIEQSDTTGEFDTTFFTQIPEQTYSVIAYATNELGRNTSSNVEQFTSPKITRAFTANDWNGTITVDRDGTVNVVQGNAASTDFPTNVGTNDTCAVANTTVKGTVEVPNDTKWNNIGEDVTVTKTPQQQPALPKYAFDSWDGSIGVTQAGALSVTDTGNAARVGINTTSPIAANDDVTPKTVDINITLTASSSYCNAGDTFTDDVEVEQPPGAALDIVLTITPAALTLASGTTSASAKWTVTGNDKQSDVILVKSGQPTWITSIVNTVAVPPETENKIAITLQANDTISERSATVIWETEDEFATDNIVIKQNVPADNHATTGVLNPDENNRSQDLDLTFNTKRVTIPITSNGDWVVSESVPGWGLESLTGANNGSVIMKGTENTSTRDRNGTITLKSTNGDTLDTISFTQGYEGDMNE